MVSPPSHSPPHQLPSSVTGEAANHEQNQPHQQGGERPTTVPISQAPVAAADDDPRHWFKSAAYALTQLYKLSSSTSADFHHASPASQEYMDRQRAEAYRSGYHEALGDVVRLLLAHRDASSSSPAQQQSSAMVPLDTLVNYLQAQGASMSEQALSRYRQHDQQSTTTSTSSRTTTADAAPLQFIHFIDTNDHHQDNHTDVYDDFIDSLTVAGRKRPRRQ